MIVRRGFLLVSVLLITLILLTLGLTFLGKRAIQYRRAASFEQAGVARGLAEAGLEEALTKFRRDVEFPPLGKDQSAFSYSEELDVDGERIGSYTVTLDGSYRYPPYMIWIVTSQGEAGRTPGSPTARRTLRAEFDISRHRGNPSPPDESADPTNARFFQVINFQDLGGL